MQVSIETTSGLERRLNITLPAAQVDDEVDTRLKKSSESIRLDGFRPGNDRATISPLTVIRSMPIQDIQAGSVPNMK